MREMPVTHNGVPLVVKFEFEPAERGDFDHPGYPANVDVLHVIAGGVEITELLEYDAISSLQDKVLEQLQ